ncbi:uncharacterized protein EV420DRAFT_1636849 [Desarmillaria tabescens]|uniref:Uncharacterized protein n=1 Tax=Armillaria tabescens TaxID=1929756 RepID=A0AA39NII8_ARMTA|nr:uncharacterized protein EV420DRAFT_1636849 [Desarmillaria tabescens]KAK0466265.1 hypothetical protein EV420DRAFT_1636849 [Desarmillaria tabescens]
MDSRDDKPEDGQTKITVKPVVGKDGNTRAFWSFEDSKIKDMYDDSVPTKKERRENLDNVTVSCDNCEKTLRRADIKRDGILSHADSSPGGSEDENPEQMVAYSKIEKIPREDTPERTQKGDTSFRQSYKGSMPVITVWFTTEDGGGAQGEVSKTMEIPWGMLNYVKEKGTIKFRSSMLGDSEHPMQAETLRESIQQSYQNGQVESNASPREKEVNKLERY